ncbi:MAG: hypothetical protein JJU28_22805 [Cyclobacteriaceae bacterium]|nr:hypothetical protein [Cyclobacteriaceae bacterium]
MAWNNPMNQLDVPVNKYLYQGKEYQDDIGLDIFDFHARAYDPIIVKTWQQDPMSNLYYSHSPYSWLKGNPLRYIDPTGMVIDDYYNRKGEFIYRDNKVTDNIMIVNETGEALASLVKDNGTEDYQNVLESNSVGINEAKISEEAASKVFTDILDKMPDVDVGKLHNGKVSIYNGGSAPGGDPAGANDPERPSGLANTAVKGVTSFRGEASEGTIKVTVNFTRQNNSELGTVSNVQNALGVHEFQGHGEKRFAIGGGKHSEAYKLQERHPSWKKTTPDFKRDMKIRKNQLLKIGD